MAYGTEPAWPISPMLAASGPVPGNPSDWAWELKWDGQRALLRIADGRVTLANRNRTEITGRYPELADGRPADEAVIDGEIVAFRDGLPDFELLQRRMHVLHPAPDLVAAIPVRLMAFDLLSHHGRPLINLPYQQRRYLLAELAPTTAIEIPEPFTATTTAQAADLRRATAERNLEGLVAKRLTAPYQPGHRSRDWLKLKNRWTTEVTVGGWKPGNGTRRLGALLIGLPTPTGLRYAGAVGTGFTGPELHRLEEALDRLAKPYCPFTSRTPPGIERQAHWIDPTLTGHVTYTRQTTDGRLREPVWLSPSR